MMKHFYTLCFVNYALCIVLFSGCGQKLPSDLPKLEPVILTIVQEGTPLEGATVQLIPRGFDSRWAAAGVTDQAGKVEFYTQGQYRGVPAGNYVVTVFKIETDPSQYENQSRPDDMDYDVWNQMIEEESKKRKSYLLVESVYDDQSTSPLSIAVVAGGSKDKQIDVGKKIREEIRR